MGGEVGRFAPTTSGPAHPGTLLAALLCWLDARSRGARLLLRLEDLDAARCRPEFTGAMRDDLAWLGLEFDGVEAQRDRATHHDAALDALKERGLLYPCSCSRAQIRSHGTRTPDGGWRYPNTCRPRVLPPGGWRESAEPLRMRLEPGKLALKDESGADLSQDPAVCFGDPLVRRRDGAISYLLANAVDDAAQGVTRVVRGRDLAPGTATQVSFLRVLGKKAPVYRHHFLLLEEAGDKLAKLHGAVGADVLRGCYSGPALCGLLAHTAGLSEAPAPVTPAALVEGFSWSRVASNDRVLRWDPPRLIVVA